MWMADKRVGCWCWDEVNLLIYVRTRHDHDVQYCTVAADSSADRHCVFLVLFSPIFSESRRAPLSIFKSSRFPEYCTYSARVRCWENRALQAGKTGQSWDGETRVGRRGHRPWQGEVCRQTVSISRQLQPDTLVNDRRKHGATLLLLLLLLWMLSHDDAWILHGGYRDGLQLQFVRIQIRLVWWQSSPCTLRPFRDWILRWCLQILKP